MADADKTTSRMPLNHQPEVGAFYRWRNRLLKSTGFRRLAAALPFTRPIVRSQARQLFDLCAGFTYTQTLYALVEGGVITRLEECPQSVKQEAASLDLPVDRALRLLKAGESIGLLKEMRAGVFGLTLKGAALAGDDGILAMVRHHRLLYQDLVDPLALLREPAPDTKLNRFYGYAANTKADQLDHDAVTEYSELMALSQVMVSSEIIARTRFMTSNHILDVGGGAGVFARTVLTKNADVKITVLDLPSVATASKAMAVNKEFAGRLGFMGGDFLNIDLPSGVDTVTLVRVLFDHDDVIVQQLLRHLYSVMPKGSSLYIAEPMAETKGAEPIGHAYYGFYLKAMGAGRIRTFAQHRANLQRAGFKRVQELKTHQPIIARLIRAQKPA